MSNRKEGFDKLTVQLFRKDFQEAIKSLEEKYSCNVSLGTLRYDEGEVRGKLTAVKGVKLAEKKSKNKFRIGDKVKINHKTIPSNNRYKVIKINKISIKVLNLDDKFGNIIKLSPSLLELV